MISSPDVEPKRESALLRGESARRATPWVRAVPAPRDAPAEDPPRATVPPAAVPPAAVPPATGERRAADRRQHVRRATDQPVPTNRPSLRLGDVYAEELARLRGHAQREGWAAGHAEGLAAAAEVVAETERAAAERLAEVQARWERRLVSATAALGAAVTQLDQAALPVAEDVRDSVIEVVLTLLEDLLGRELALAGSPGLDAVRRALTLLPADAPAVVRLHPDDLAEVPAEALAQLPSTVVVLGDPAVERAGAVAESGPSRVDAQLSAALQRVRAVLAP
ncbi:FliH/SctL family protein [Geodermatophilus sp. SYSU D00758]